MKSHTLWYSYIIKIKVFSQTWQRSSRAEDAKRFWLWWEELFFMTKICCSQTFFFKLSVCSLYIEHNLSFRCSPPQIEHNKQLLIMAPNGCLNSLKERNKHCSLQWQLYNIQHWNSLIGLMSRQSNNKPSNCLSLKLGNLFMPFMVHAMSETATNKKKKGSHWA